MTDLINLPQLEIEIKFYLGQTAQNIIEVGKRLIQAKSLVNHGEWQQWLEHNFQLSQATATRFMNCAEKFSNLATLQSLKSSQMIALLSLPDAAETEKFIAEKAAEGKKVADMTIKKLREAQELTEQVTFAKIKLGELLAALPKDKGGRPKETVDTAVDSFNQKPKSNSVNYSPLYLHNLAQERI